MGKEAFPVVQTVEREQIDFISKDLATKIHGYVWKPAHGIEPRGVVQLVHGMAEHIERYDAFARFLASKGFVACGHDHVAHGESVTDPSRRGCLPAGNGKDVLIGDVHTLHDSMVERYPGTPYFLFGHSMGSFVVRAYAARYSDTLSGVIISGTGHIAPAVSRMGNLLARLVCAIKGPDAKSPLLHNMGVGSYNKRIEEPRTEVDWISYDTGNIDRYANDERCGFMFSAAGYAALTDLTAEIATPEHARRLGNDLPLLFISGADDPVGDFGKGVRTASGLAREAGVRDVTIKLYDGMRHEILNECDRQRVYTDILTWIEDHL